MNAFWKNLSQLAQGQLFNHGYLSHETAVRLMRERPRGKVQRIRSNPRKPAVWPRLAIPH